MLVVLTATAGCSSTSPTAGSTTSAPTTAAPTTAAPTTATPTTATPTTAASTAPASTTLPTAAPSSTPTASDEAAFATLPCDDQLFAAASIETGAECGTFTAPEDRSRAGGRSVVLPVVIHPSLRGDDSLTPVVYISGGPGDRGIAHDWSKRVMAQDRRIISLDLRGTGAATPNLECQEIDDALWADLENGASSGPAELERGSAAQRACHARLNSIADLDQYDSPTIAADVVDLRRALGLEQWIVYALSYGTSVAQQVIRLDPDGTAAVILDSLVPPDVDDGPGADARRQQGAYERLFAACAADPACQAAHPDLAAELSTAVELLDATPYQVAFTDVDGVARTVRLNGDDILIGGFNAMKDASLIPLLPSVITQLAQAQFGILDALVADQLVDRAWAVAEGQTRSVLCADRQATAGTADPAALRGELPFAVVTESTLGCSDWPVSAVPDGFASLVATSVPTLVLAGELDPVTPADDAERVAVSLGATTTYVRLPALSHAVLFTDEACPGAIADAFLASPRARVDTACVASMPRAHFVV